MIKKIRSAKVMFKEIELCVFTRVNYFSNKDRK